MTKKYLYLFIAMVFPFLFVTSAFAQVNKGDSAMRIGFFKRAEAIRKLQKRFDSLSEEFILKSSQFLLLQKNTEDLRDQLKALRADTAAKGIKIVILRNDTGNLKMLMSLWQAKNKSDSIGFAVKLNSLYSIYVNDKARKEFTIDSLRGIITNIHPAMDRNIVTLNDSAALKVFLDATQFDTAIIRMPTPELRKFIQPPPSSSSLHPVPLDYLYVLLGVAGGLLLLYLYSRFRALSKRKQIAAPTTTTIYCRISDVHKDYVICLALIDQGDSQLKFEERMFEHKLISEALGKDNLKPSAMFEVEVVDSHAQKTFVFRKSNMSEARLFDKYFTEAG